MGILMTFPAVSSDSETLFSLPNQNATVGTPDTHPAPSAGEDSESQVPDSHLKLLADRIKPLSLKQYRSIAETARAQGLPEVVARALPWVLADPQEGLRQLRNPDTELIGNVVARVLILNTLNAPVLKALENLRGSELRFAGEFLLPPYTVVSDQTALRFDATRYADAAEALDEMLTQMSAMDDHVEKVNPYLDDIAERGVRTGGILFPLVVDLPGAPTFGAFETADCYGRVHAAQKAATITLKHVLDRAQVVPRDEESFKKHPWKTHRNKLLAICGKVRSGAPLSDAERRNLTVATMPRTTIVLAGDTTAPLDEVRRRVVSQAHLEPATPFSATTTAQVRAEAVLAEQEQRGALPQAPPLNPAQVRSALNDPATAAAQGLLHLDEIAVLATAAFLPKQGTSADRVIAKALATRGHVGNSKFVRQGLAAEVALRHVPAAANKPARRSAFDRALRWPQLRGRTLDRREVSELLHQALTQELPDYQAARDIGEKPLVGDASAQLAIMGSFWLVTSGSAPILNRTAFGTRSHDDDQDEETGESTNTTPDESKTSKGDYREPNLIVIELATTEHGLKQLAQAIYDGRAGRQVRHLDTETLDDPTDRPVPNAPVLNASALRRLTLPVGGEGVSVPDTTAKARLARLGVKLNTQVLQVQSLVEQMASTADNDDRPWVRRHGWSDPHECLPKLEEISRQAGGWKQLHDALSERLTEDLDEHTEPLEG